MFCSQCGNTNNESERFCRKCGTAFDNALLSPDRRNVVQRADSQEIPAPIPSKDPDEMIGHGIGSIFVGDGFFMVAVILSATDTAISSLLWLLLLIPAFFFFGKGFGDVLHAKQIRRRLKEKQLKDELMIAELPPPNTSVIDIIKDSGNLIATTSTIDGTTRELK